MKKLKKLARVRELRAVRAERALLQKRDLAVRQQYRDPAVAGVCEGHFGRPRAHATRAKRSHFFTPKIRT